MSASCRLAIVGGTVTGFLNVLHMTAMFLLRNLVSV